MILGTTKILCSIMFHWKRKFRERVDTPDTRCLLVSVLRQFLWVYSWIRYSRPSCLSHYHGCMFATAAPPTVLALLWLLSWTAKLCVYFKLNCYKEKTALGISFLWVIEGLHLPGTQITSIFWRSTSKTRPFPIKTRVIWVPGGYREYEMATVWKSLWTNHTPQVLFFSWWWCMPRSTDISIPHVSHPMEPLETFFWMSNIQAILRDLCWDGSCPGHSTYGVFSIPTFTP